MSTTHQSVAVIGGGYLGGRLVKALNHSKYKVKVSFRSEEPKVQLEGVEYYFCDVSKGLVAADDNLFDADCVVICIPPGFKKGLGEFYSSNIKGLVDLAQKQGCRHIIYTSSTGIYPEAGVFDENAVIDNRTDKMQALYDAELEVLNSGVKNKHLLRLAGLMGPNRNPAKFPIKLEKLNTTANVNMVMIDDVVDVVLSLVSEVDTPSAVYNICAPHHPTKNSFYRYLKQMNHQPLVGFATAEHEVEGKRVLGDLITQHTDFQYAYPNLFVAAQTLVE